MSRQVEVWGTSTQRMNSNKQYRWLRLGVVGDEVLMG